MLQLSGSGSTTAASLRQPVLASFDDQVARTWKPRASLRWLCASFLVCDTALFSQAAQDMLQTSQIAGNSAAVS